MKPLLVDLCCGAGGASLGYAAGGFEVEGVDNRPQPQYPLKFTQADVLTLDLEKAFPLASCFHASPPCQVNSISTKRYRNIGKAYPDVLRPLREKLLQTGKPFIIENVMGAPMRRDLILCGEMFGLRVIRHRLFEIEGFTVLQPPHQKHKGYATGIKDRFAYRAPVSEGPAVGKDLYYYTVCGHGRRERDKLEAWRAAMGIFHMTRKELTQAIPSLYTEYIARQGILNFIPEIVQ